MLKYLHVASAIDTDEEDNPDDRHSVISSVSGMDTSFTDNSDLDSCRMPGSVTLTTHIE